MADPLTLHPFSLALRSRPKSEDACKSEVLFNEHGYAESGLEVVPFSSPEAIYDREHFAPQAVYGPQDYPPEVAHSTDLIPAHNPHDYPPEHVSGYNPRDYPPEHVPEHDPDKPSSLDTPTKGLGRENEDSVKEIEKSDTAHSFPRSRRKWLWIALAVVAIVLVAAGVGLGVGLTIGRNSRASSSASASGSTSGSDPGSGSGSGSGSYGVPYVSPTNAAKSSIQVNTSLAAVTCDNGDRWVFLQDIKGQIRGAQRSSSSASWSISSNAYNFGTPAPGTGMAASCSNASSLGADNPSLLISLAYVNTSNSFQESIYDGTSWSDNPIPPQLQPPSNDTKLSIMAGVLPSFSEGNGTSGSFFGESWFTAAMYESENSIVLLDLSTLDEGSTQNISNSFTQFAGVGSQPITDEGFACIYDGLLPPDYTRLYTQCFVANSTTVPPDGILWEYNRSSLANNDTIEPRTLKASTQSLHEGSTTTDLSLFLLPNSQLALVSLLANNSIALFVGSVGGPLTRGPFISPSPISTTTTHLSATSLLSNSTLIYFYYQANASALAEIFFDTDNESWAQQPAFISIT
ncbi:hypothetical protein MMC15_007618 [Xylographa vitiligo]|nr:hypothetical protein [Xylographa vitiligo]